MNKENSTFVVIAAVLIAIVFAYFVGVGNERRALEKYESIKMEKEMNNKPYRNALVVVDCQNDFITGSLANEVAQRKVPNIVNKIRGFKGDVIFVTLDTHYGDYLNTREGKKLPVPHCIVNTHGIKLEPNIEAAIKDAELRNIKVQYISKNTFGSTELATLLERGMAKNSRVEFVGFCTDICVVSNALLAKASLASVSDIVVDATCCAGVTVESHKAAIKTMEACQITVLNPYN